VAVSSPGFSDLSRRSKRSAKAEAEGRSIKIPCPLRQRLPITEHLVCIRAGLRRRPRYSESRKCYNPNQSRPAPPPPQSPSPRTQHVVLLCPLDPERLQPGGAFRILLRSINLFGRVVRQVKQLPGRLFPVGDELPTVLIDRATAIDSACQTSLAGMYTSACERSRYDGVIELPNEG